MDIEVYLTQWLLKGFHMPCSSFPIQHSTVGTPSVLYLQIETLHCLFGPGFMAPPSWTGGYDRGVATYKSTFPASSTTPGHFHMYIARMMNIYSEHL